MYTSNAAARSCGLLSADELQVPAERFVGRSLVAGGDEVE
jgi:hypothetical protein